MDKIKEFLKNPIYIGVVGLVVGTIFGLVVLGWGIWPVQWTDAEPAALQSDYKKDYLCMTINSYIANQDAQVLAVRWEGLGNEAQAVLDGLTPADCNYKSSVEIDAFKQVVSLKTPSDLVTEEVKPTDGKKSDKKDITVTEIPEKDITETKTISILPDRKSVV